jgi:C4-dicarboxylate-specific signal transduction histidine kinase
MARLVGYFLLLSLLTIGLVDYLVYVRATEALKQSLFSRLGAVATLKEDSLNRWVDEQRRDVVFIAWLPEARAQAGTLLSHPPADPEYQATYARLSDYLKFVVTSTSDSAELFLLDLNGKIVLSTDKSHEGQSRAGDLYFAQSQSSTYVQNVYTSPQTGKPTITVATPMFDQDNRRVGVLASHLNLARIDRIILERTGLGESGETYLVDTSNMFVSETLFSQQTSSAAGSAHSEGIDAALQGQDGEGLYLNYQGMPVIGVYRWLDDRQVTLLAEMSQQEAFAPARQLAWTIFFIGLISAGALAGGVYLLARQIARPILAITRTAAQVAAGDLTQTAPVLTEDEVGVLAQVFNQMTGQLRLLYEGLEKKVAERTAELALVNFSLQQEVAERKRAEGVLRGQNEYLAALHETTLGLISHLDLNDLLETLITRAGQLLDAPHGYIYLARPGQPERDALIELKVGVGVFSQQIGDLMQPGEGLAGKVWQTGQPLVVADYDAWLGRSAKFAHHLIGAITGIPLTQHSLNGWVDIQPIRPQVVGVLGIAYGVESDRTFGQEEVELLSRFGQLASVALDNVRLYEAAQRQVAELEALRQVSLSMTASLELPAVLKAILASAFQLLSGTRDAYIYLYHSADDTQDQPDRLEFGAALWFDGREPPLAQPRPYGVSYITAWEGSPIVIADMRTNPLYHPVHSDPAWQEYIEAGIAYLPLKIGQRVVGVMSLAYQPPRPLPETELRALYLLADQAAIAIENARLYLTVQQELGERQRAEEALRRQNEYLAALHEVTLGLIRRLDLDELLEGLVTRAGGLMGTMHGNILLLEPDGTEMRVRVGTGVESEFVGYCTRPGEGLGGKVWQSGQPLVVDDYRIWAGRKSEVSHDIFRATVGVPLKSAGQVVGVLSLDYLDEGRTFGEGEVEILQRFAQLAVVALDNARLYTAAQQAKDVAEGANQELSQALEHLQTTQSHLVEAEKMAALGGLVAGVAHEINTPVGIGVTAASLLEERTRAFRQAYQTGQMKRSDMEKYLDIAGQSSTMILNNLNRAAELIQSFKQVAVDQSSEKRRRFPVKAYLEEVLISLRPKLKRTQHSIEIFGPEELALDSYPGAFSQIVTNLVMNSLVHAYEPGEAGRLVFDLQQKGSYFVFEYTDDGRGIAKEHMSKIFDPFFTTKRGHGGSGLGLHIIYNLVTQKLGGTIRCESKEGQGTRFVIEMPI